MKKLVFAFAALVGLCVLGACSEKAETLVGEWGMDSVIVEDGQQVKLTWNLNLKADGNQASALNLVMDGDEKGMKIHMPFGIAYEGTWNSDEKILVLKADTASVKFDFNADSLVIEATDKETEAMISMLKPKMAEAMKKQFSDPSGEFGQDFILKGDTFDYNLLPGELVLAARKDSTVFSFKRK